MSSYEYNQLLKFLYFEGYADSYAEAEELLESMSDEEFEDLNEKSLAHSFPLKPSERRSAENIRRMLDGDYSVPPGGSARSRSAKKVKKQPKESTPQQPRRIGVQNVDYREQFDAIVEYLFVEGYADTIESAEEMVESISAEWIDEIMEKFDPKDYKEYHQNNHRDKRNPSDEWDAQEKDWQDSKGDIRDPHTQARGVKKKKGPKDVNEKYVKAMDSTGRGADRRAHTTDPTVRPIRRKPTPEKYKHSEAEFDSTLTSPGARKRKTERRQAVGGKSYTEAYEVIVDYLYSEGYANTIQFAEVMAENISENWMNEILEAYVELSATKKDAMTNRANKLLNKDDWNKANKIEKARTHDPEASKAKERANRERGKAQGR